MIRTEIPGKFTPERSEIARQILRARWFDLYKARGPYLSDAGLTTYNHRLNGLQAYFDYVRSLEGQKTVLDVGAGTTRAVAELAQSEMGSGIDFIAIGLRYNIRRSAKAPRLNPDKVYKTSVERLAGIQDQSISGIISNRGLCYSKSPKTAVNSIDRVLKPGGVIKANFSIKDEIEDEDRPFTDWKSYGRFAQRFSELGYDTAFEFFGGVVLLAIKPGGGSELSAKELIKKDEAVKGLREVLTKEHIVFSG